MRGTVLGCAIVLAVAGCSAKPRDPVVHQVEIRAMQFVPAELAVAVGDTVVWRNRDVVPHTVTSAGRFDSQQIEGEQEWRYTVSGAGEIPYVCTYHPMMKATLTAR